MRILGILGDKKEFISNYVKPMKLAREQQLNVRYAKMQLKKLADHLKPIALRRDVSYLK